MGAGTLIRADATDWANEPPGPTGGPGLSRRKESIMIRRTLVFSALLTASTLLAAAPQTQPTSSSAAPAAHQAHPQGWGWGWGRPWGGWGGWGGWGYPYGGWGYPYGGWGYFPLR
jgi:hypothetical protein